MPQQGGIVKALFRYLTRRSPKKYITVVIGGIPQDCLVTSESGAGYAITYTQVVQAPNELLYLKRTLVVSKTSKNIIAITAR